MKRVDEEGAPETAGFREFSVLLGCKPGYVTQLRKAGRLVLTSDGKRVLVAESRQLIEETRDPSKAGVSARHAAKRAEKAASPAQPSEKLAPASAGQGGEGGDSDFVPPADPHAKRRAKALADKEEALARKALRDEQIELGRLLDVDQVREVVAGAVATMRTSLENIPIALAPELAAANSEDRVRALLVEAIEHGLGECARKLGALAKAGVA